ncbi:unnamed protein product [Meganyctiphanes norvegica]|uniref:Major facilitator superfamily (MFS) profile domain-containing protein n=1 Tax=Meganyctiphanes norvegica TaxID=48144 RepID=A0AAV2QGI1_MEGNR
MSFKDNTISSALASLLKNITIEPLLFLYYMSYYQLNVVTENFRLERYCRVSLGYQDRCDHLVDGTNDEELEVEVQQLENEFLVYESYISVTFTVLFLIYIASWSDKHGRRVPILMGLAGWILYCIVYILAVIFTSWTPWVLLLAAFLRSLGGWHWVIAMASYAHIADVSSEESRTARMTLMMVCKGFGMSAGTALGPILHNLSGYALVFAVSMALYIVCFIWSIFVIPHRPYNPQDSTIRKSKCERILSIPRKIKQNVKDLISTSLRKREGHKRFLINYLPFLMLLQLNALAKKMYLWSRIVLHWDMDVYSLYLTTDKLMCTIVMLLLAPIIKIFKPHDCVTGACTQLTMFCKTLAFGLLTNPSQWYVPYIFTLVPQWLNIVCTRSLVSKQCSPDEIGRAFSIIAVGECIWPIVENTLYGAVYAATVDTYPSAIHLVESAHSLVVFTSYLAIHLLLRWQDFKDSRNVALKR